MRLLASLSLQLVIAAIVCPRLARAQVVEDPLGPLQCYQLADSRELAQQTALDLCIGALSQAPGVCYATADDRHHELTEQQKVNLCRGATSLEPLSCYERLDAVGTLTEQQIIAYCATSCPLGPAPPQSSAPECFGEAYEVTDLAEQQIGQLCYGSRSTGPVRCYLAGDAIGTLTETQIIQLCTTASGCQYQYGAPTQGYGTAPGYGATRGY